MKILLFIVFIIGPLSVQAQSSDEEGNQAIIEMLVVAKATGMCGVFNQLITFQQATKMEGGDDFLMRFLNTEAARLGLTLKALTGQCPEWVQTYGVYMQMFGFEK
jgi:hypothetical protein